MTLAALQPVALAYLDGDGDAIPFWRMATAPVDALRARAEAVAGAVRRRQGGRHGGGRRRRLAPRPRRSRRSASRSTVARTAADARPAAVRRRASSPGSTTAAVVCDLRTVDPADDDAPSPPCCAALPRRDAAVAAHRPPMRVVATAGHVDHGKSTLVLRADRAPTPTASPEEKARGLTIDLGFAFTTLPSGQERRRSSTCPATCGSSRTCSPASAPSSVAVLVVAADRGVDAPERGAPPDPRSARRPPRRGRAHQGRPRRRRRRSSWPGSRSPSASPAPSLRHAGRSWPSTPARGRGLDELRAALDAVLARARRRRRPRPAAAVGRPGLRGDGRRDGRDRHPHRRLPRASSELAIARTACPGVRRIESDHEAAARRPARARRVALNLAGVDHRRWPRGDAPRAPGPVGRDRPSSTSPSAARVARRRVGRARSVACTSGRASTPRPMRSLDDTAGSPAAASPCPLPLAPGDRIVLRDSGRSPRPSAEPRCSTSSPTGAPGDAPAASAAARTPAAGRAGRGSRPATRTPRAGCGAEQAATSRPSSSSPTMRVRSARRSSVDRGARCADGASPGRLGRGRGIAAAARPGSRQPATLAGALRARHRPGSGPPGREDRRRSWSSRGRALRPAIRGA